jgi:hypothetical protein
MSNHDEESAPLDDVQAGDHTGEVESGELPPAPEELQAAAAGETITPFLERQLRDIRTALEQKDWQGLADTLGLETFIIEGHPEPVSQIVAKIAPLTTNLCDFEGVLLRVSKHEVEEDRARFSFRFRIMWNSCDDWEDHDLYVDAHIGYQRDEQGWKASYLSLSRAYPQSEQPVKAPAPAAPPEAPKAVPPVPPRKTVVPTARVKRPAAKAPLRAAAPSKPAPPPPPTPAPAPKAAEQPLTDEYFSQAAAQYFAQVAGGAVQPSEKKSQGLGSSVGGKHHLLYVPVVMHEDLIKKILGND